MLLVEDEPALLHLLNRYLARCGFDVLAHRLPEEAIKDFRGAPAAIKLAVVDYSLPGMNGEELARELRSIVPGLPVVLTSGTPFGQPDEPATRFLQKPFTPQVLVDVIGSLLRG